MICEWLTRAAACSSAHKLLGMPRGASCTSEEVVLGRLLDAAAAALKEGRVLRPAEVHDFLDLLVAKSGAEAVLKHVMAEEVVAVDWDYCPVGFALERAVTVFVGEAVHKAEEFYEPYSALLRRFGAVHVFARADTDEAKEEVFRRYGAEAAVTCLRKPPWRIKTYVLSCETPNPAAELLARAMGQVLYTGTRKAAPGIYVV